MKRTNTGLSMVLGVLLTLIVVVGIVAMQLIALDNFGASTNQALDIEDKKLQERLYITGLENKTIGNVDYIDQITIKNAGSNAIILRSIYIDQVFLFDPSDLTINPNGGVINANSTLNVTFSGLSAPEPFERASLITVATERGTKSMAYEGTLANPDPTIINVETNFGPLRLLFDEFYHAEYDPRTGSTGPWQPGWSVDTSKEDEVVWKVSVKNIDTVDIRLTNTTCFVLMSIDGASDVRSWYINTATSVLIESQNTVSLEFKWNLPKNRGLNDVPAIFSVECRSKIFMAFFGSYQPSGVSYAQTIPFESVAIYKGN